MIRIAVVSLCLAGCASEAPAPEAAPEPAPRVKARPAPEPPEVSRWAELAAELAVSLEAAGAECGAVAKAMQGFVTLHEQELDRAQKALVAWEDHAPAGVVAVFYRRTFPSVEVRIDAGIRCKDDPGTVAAYDRFFAVLGLDLR